ncbi:MAG TPA: DUF1122 family protein [Candidatus Thermoplasmatota archaeon]|nr:DUF1122 family protein [Candidatus Thermoplasmatota archaeon]
MFEECLSLLSKGIASNDGIIGITDILPGRSSNEKRAMVFLKQDKDFVNLMDVTFFVGVKPWYHPWIEITYTYDLKMDDQKVFLYFSSDIEQTLVRLFCDALPPAGKLFVSYDSDDETRRGLMMNIPMVLSRLGFIMYTYGCTWFKDWYFPEGGFEGGQKLQGEKPLTPADKKRHLYQLKNEVSDFIVEKKKQSFISAFEEKALNRGNIFLKNISID